MADTSFRYGQTPRPQVGLDTFVVLDRAVVDLAERRFMKVLDAPVQLHLLASLVAQAESWLGEQVVAARDDGVSWAVIGRLLGVSAAVARQRYSSATTATADPPQPDRRPDNTRARPW